MSIEQPTVLDIDSTKREGGKHYVTKGRANTLGLFIEVIVLKSLTMVCSIRLESVTQ